jgi:tRNA threonylcarbamoyladenosine biosynthesis protein TsaE
MRITSTSPEMTQRIAAALARYLREGDLVALSGPLGAGKTCFAQGLARGLGIRQVVASPSFVLAKHYPGSPGLLHVDAYRLSSAEEFWDLGLQEQLETSIAAVEWAENIEPALPDDRLTIALHDAGGDTRTIEFGAGGGRFEAVLDSLRNEPELRRPTETDA